MKTIAALSLAGAIRLTRNRMTPMAMAENQEKIQETTNSNSKRSDDKKHVNEFISQLNRSRSSSDSSLSSVFGVQFGKTLQELLTIQSLPVPGSGELKDVKRTDLLPWVTDMLKASTDKQGIEALKTEFLKTQRPVQMQAKENEHENDSEKVQEKEANEHENDSEKVLGERLLGLETNQASEASDISRRFEEALDGKTATHIIDDNMVEHIAMQLEGQQVETHDETLTNQEDPVKSVWFSMAAELKQKKNLKDLKKRIVTVLTKNETHNQEANEAEIAKIANMANMAVAVLATMKLKGKTQPDAQDHEVTKDVEKTKEDEVTKDLKVTKELISSMLLKGKTEPKAEDHEVTKDVEKTELEKTPKELISSMLNNVEGLTMQLTRFRNVLHLSPEDGDKAQKAHKELGELFVEYALSLEQEQQLNENEKSTTQAFDERDKETIQKFKELFGDESGDESDHSNAEMQ